MIPFWNFSNEYKLIKKPLFKKINNVLSRGDIFFGEELKKFEKNFSKIYNFKNVTAVGSGTDALIIALKSLGIKNGDEVITVANSAVPTASAIRSVGAKIKFVDIGNDYLINPNLIEKNINKKTKAIIPVHLYGQSCQMDKICQIAKKYKINVIEDCAQAQGAKYKGNYVGSFGDIGCFSFYPTKILGAYGDGGLVVSKSKKIDEKVKRIRFYGFEKTKKNKFFNKYYSVEDGINSRLDEIQSSILNIKLPMTKQFIKKRNNIAKIYFKELKNTGLALPTINKSCLHVFHLFVVYHPSRKIIIKYLEKKNVNIVIHYPFALHKMKAFKEFYSSKLHLTEKLSKGIFSLPLYPELKKREIRLICKYIKDAIKFQI